jgi:hypothetical protein
MAVRIQKPAVNIREKLAELERPIGVNGAALMATDTPQDAFSLIGAGRRNLIINGNFQVSQREDYTTSAVTAGHDSYWLDRWMSLKNGTTSTVQRVTRTVNGVSKYAARIVCTVGGTGIMGFNQRIELQNIPVGETLTVSCWVRTNHPFVGFRTNTFRGLSGDAPFKFVGDGNWRKVSWTFDSTGTVGTPDILIVAYNNTNVSIAAGDYIEIADVQLEEGKIATPFEYRSYGQELALCQRYYQVAMDASSHVAVYAGRSSGTTSIIASIPLSVPLRALPSMTGSNADIVYAYSGGARVNSTSGTVALNTSLPFKENITTVLVAFGGFSGLTDDRSYTIGGYGGTAKLVFNSEL